MAPRTSPSAPASPSSWARAILVGTFSGAFAYATVHAVLRSDVRFLERALGVAPLPFLGLWLVQAAICATVAALLVVAHACVDVLFLRLRRPLMPAGATLYAAAVGAFAALSSLRPAAYLVYMGPYHVAETLGFVAFVVLLMPLAGRIGLELGNLAAERF